MPRRTVRLIQMLFQPEALERFGGVALPIHGTNGKRLLAIVRGKARGAHSASGSGRSLMRPSQRFTLNNSANGTPQRMLTLIPRCCRHPAKNECGGDAATTPVMNGTHCSLSGQNVVTKVVPTAQEGVRPQRILLLRFFQK